MAKSGVRIKFNHIPKIMRENPVKADLAIEAMAFDGERYVKQIMNDSPKDGRTYIVGSGQTHVASSPGNPPRPDTKTLINSIHVKSKGLALYAIRAATDYAFGLEFGTSKTAARPAFIPMLVFLKKNADTFFDDFFGAI